MKSKLQIQIPAAILILLATLATAPAQPAPAAPTPINPATGMPATATGGGGINPATGQPVPDLASFEQRLQRIIAQKAQPSPEPQWIASDWPDPGIVVTNVNYDNLPLFEVARDLRERFKNQFDILPMPKAFDKDWGSEIEIQLQMKDVKASDIFNAMNLVFENDRTPVRWELKINYNRPTAQLRVLPEAVPMTPAPPKMKEATRRMVYFVGNLIGDEKSGGMTMQQIVKTITDIWPADFGPPEGVLQFHEQAQLLVAKGTQEQLQFIQQVISALEAKAQTDTNKRISEDLKSKAEQLRNNSKTPIELK